ncbi:hypothetical protein SELMODRAFT_432052 [Selaginella moellendorffii]|uniref:Uncharacterized protein n=1 Tax=Selaginella moellendorffii TaxID=88036 RepID=D8TEU1_SELML|nr:hypothetical protein SELMODRAFT_432052 [Selaginella moellendorffii]
MAERSNEAEKMEKWMKATSEIEKRGIKRICRRDFMINDRFFPTDSQARKLDVLGCPPSEYMYGFASSDGVSRKITTYISKVKQFKRINKRKNVAPGLTVFTTQILNGKKYNKNRLPNKAEVQKVLIIFPELVLLKWLIDLTFLHCHSLPRQVLIEAKQLEKSMNDNSVAMSCPTEDMTAWQVLDLKHES